MPNSIFLPIFVEGEREKESEKRGREKYREKERKSDRREERKTKNERDSKLSISRIFIGHSFFY